MATKIKEDPVAKQKRLLARSDALRLAVAQESQSLKKPLAMADKLRNGAKWASEHPALPLAAGLVLTLVLPKRALIIWGGRLWGAWTTYNQVRNVIAKPSSKQRSKRHQAKD